MAADRSPIPTATLPPDDGVLPPGSVGITRAEFDSLAAELRELRRAYEHELADRLRDARAHGSPGDNEDVHAVHEEVSVKAARVARLEELLRSAPIVDREFDGCVSLGCTVRVARDDGRRAEYVLIGRRGADSALHAVSAASPVGRALLGARRGELVHVELPDGRARSLRILDVTRAGVDARPAIDGDAEAA